MWNVIASFYGGNIGVSTPFIASDMMSRLFAIEQQLVEWEHLLPPSLALQKVEKLAAISDVVDPTTFYIERFRIILTLRYHNLCVLMYRPILVKFLDIIGRDVLDTEVQEVKLMQQIGHNSIYKCAQASMDIIAIVSTIVASDGYQRNLLGAWWFSLYYTFNAALVIFAALLVERDRELHGAQPLSLPIPSHKLHRSLSDASQALRLLDSKNKMVDTCALYLEQLTGFLMAIGEQRLSFYFSLYIITILLAHILTGYAVDAPSIPVPVSMNSAFGNNARTSLPSYRSDFILPPSRETITNLSPVGMDFGEFVLDGDINFMSQLAGTGIAYSIPAALEMNNVMNHMESK